MKKNKVKKLMLKRDTLRDLGATSAHGGATFGCGISKSPCYDPETTVDPGCPSELTCPQTQPNTQCAC